MSTDPSNQNPTAPGISADSPVLGDEFDSEVFKKRFGLVVSGEVAEVIVRGAERLNITPQHYARMMLTDGLKANGFLTKKWKRGAMNYEVEPGRG